MATSALALANSAVPRDACRRKAMQVMLTTIAAVESGWNFCGGSSPSIGTILITCGYIMGGKRVPWW